MKQVEYYKNGNRTLRIKYEGIKKVLEKQNKEIERLNNIINELQKYLNEQIQKSWEIEEQCYENIESKLQELEGSEKAIPPEVIGTNGEDGGLFDYGDR